LEEWRKPKPTDGLVSKYINRRLSTRITAFIINKGINVTPNQITILSLLTALITAAIIWLGHPIIGGLMVEVASIVDGIDGELARAKGITSRLGGFLDAMMDRLADISIIVAITYYAFLTTGMKPMVLAIISLVALSGDLLVSYLHARGEASLGIHPSMIGAFRGFASRDVRLLIIAVLLALNLPTLALIVVAVISYTYVIGKLLEVYAEFKGESLN